VLCIATDNFAVMSASPLIAGGVVSLTRPWRWARTSPPHRRTRWRRLRGRRQRASLPRAPISRPDRRACNAPPPTRRRRQRSHLHRQVRCSDSAGNDTTSSVEVRVPKSPSGDDATIAKPARRRSVGRR
jgi:hypothetical protein